MKFIVIFAILIAMIPGVALAETNTTDRDCPDGLEQIKIEINEGDTEKT